MELKIGDLVVLTAGSMRMAIEALEDGRASVVWCHEGVIGRDAFDQKLLRKWEDRGGDADSSRGRPREGGRSFGGDRDRGGDRGGRSFGGGDRGGDRGSDRGGRSHGGDRPDRGGDRGADRGADRGGDRPPRGGKPGWDGKPREKKFFRKD